MFDVLFHHADTENYATI